MAQRERTFYWPRVYPETGGTVSVTFLCTENVAGGSIVAHTCVSALPMPAGPPASSLSSTGRLDYANPRHLRALLTELLLSDTTLVLGAPRQAFRDFATWLEMGGWLDDAADASAIRPGCR